MKVSIENTEYYLWGGNCEGWHLAKSDCLSVIQERVPSGGSEIRHYHRKSEQFFYVLSGVATLEIEGSTHQLNPLQGIHVPAGNRHQLRNDNQEDLIFLVISTPPSHGDRVEA